MPWPHRRARRFSCCKTSIGSCSPPRSFRPSSRQILAGKQNRTILVILSPIVQIPVELEKMFVVIEHELPGREQLAEIARGIAIEEGELPGRDRNWKPCWMRRRD